MTPRHLATVTVAGEAIAGDWDGSGRFALDGLRITWGRSDLYDQPSNTTARAVIIDPSGAWASNPDLYGETLTIDRPAARVFRGTIDSIEIAQRAM
ncbi:hypothetical protein [Cryobacterium sp. Y62]|uniref:hypothetical protein n=1 Tax=Cryobacterium sp. Y62 TaxID=2048284 RepID=UPI0011AFE522|nr:hypothetical protein [Cryobacterium sp. Y62]